MDIKKAEDKLKNADSFLTTLKDVLKNHWGILSLIALGGFIYWAVNLPDEELEDNHKVKPVVKEHHKKSSKDYYITKKTYIIDDYGYRKGDTVYIDYYSDGVVEKYYTDFQTYNEKD
jgi:hypothetical protein